MQTFFVGQRWIWLLCLVLPALGLSAQTQIFGRVLDEEGQPLPSALLRLQGRQDLSLSSDAKGEFRFNKLRAGQVRLLVEHPGFETLALDLELAGEGERDLGELKLGFTAYNLDALSVKGTRLGAQTPMASTTLSREDIAKNNLGVDLPFLLDQTPSVVVNSDAGAGIGYTGLRIRGSDGTRINVTINGIPLNDAESQGVFWVNMPDFASSVDNIQIQRGVGTSTQGAGAFGASINLQTNQVNEKPYAELGNSYGSFNSRRHSLRFGSGLINERWTFDGRLSLIRSDGFIDRASSDLRSYYLSAAHVGERSILRFNLFSGKEVTYQAWGGVPIQYIDTNRTYNPYTYEREVDDYQQTHYRLLYNHSFSRRLQLNTALHYTRGMGYYEQFRSNDRLSNYGLEPVEIEGTTINRSDLIRRRWLDNHFAGFVYGLHYEEGPWQAVLGGGWNQYRGKHFGEVIWARFASNGEIRHRYYDNDAVKTDGNTYLKVQYAPSSRWQWFGDLQHRLVLYDFVGFDNNLNNVEQTAQLHFFNPKIGFNHRPNANSRYYGSLSVANREPNRRDYTESSPESRPRPERLYDLELGYQFGREQFQLGANAFGMYYQDQLVLNGQINDVGAFVRVNVPQSYRAGLELQSLWQPLPYLRWTANLAYSQNRILRLTEFVDDWDTGEQIAINYQNSPLAFSPDWVGGSELSYFRQLNAQHQVELALISKFVSRQFLDNTGDKQRSLDPYFLQDARLAWRFSPPKGLQEARVTLLVRNIFNKMYASNGWTYRFRSEGYDPRTDDPYAQAELGRQGFYHLIGLYPQAGIHYQLGLDLRL